MVLVHALLIALQSNLNSSNTNGSFTITTSNSFLSPYKILYDSSKEQKFMEMFFFYNEIVCSVYSLESPQWGNSNEYTQHTIIV